MIRLPLLAVLLCVHPIHAADTRDLPKDWAFHPLRPVSVPAMEAGDRVRNDIDRFVLRRLSEAGLKPNPRADRRTLIRRLTFDLHGLPPTPEEIAVFESDRSNRAVERLIDRLLASPRYGERWARHWLDIARFSESQGYERDKIRPHAWRYRDYVIQAFNDDRPYDRFMREQIAGDVLSPPTREGIVATGFLVAGPYDEVGNGQKSNVMRMRVREEELEDMISAVGQTFLGVTINCSRCHDHKFDPIPMTDYYSVKAVFEGVRHGERSILTPADVARRKTERAAHAERLARLRRERDELEKIGRDRAARTVGHTGPVPHARWGFENDGTDAPGALQGDAKIIAGALVLDGDGDWFQTPPLREPIRTKTLEAWVYVTDPDHRKGGIITLEDARGRTFDAIVYAERRPREWQAGSNNHRRTRDVGGPPEGAPADKAVHVAVVYSPDNRITLYRDGRPYGASYTPTGADGVLQTFAANEARVLLGKRHTGGGSPYFKGRIEEARLYDRALSAAEIAASFAAGPGGVSRDAILAVLSEPQRKKLTALETAMGELERQLAATSEEPRSYAANPRQPGPTHLLARGEVLEKQQVMIPAALSAIRQPDPDFNFTPATPEAERRRRFAEWLAHPDNPLPARVMMNRLWQHHFGRGLVDTPSDFGASGARPSHPDLLDWLAAAFIESGWSMKAMHRLILNSATWQQSGTWRKTAAAADADNRLLWRFAPRRLEAEAVRDSMLALAGTLNLAMGGPGYRPFELVINNTHFYLRRDKAGPEFNRRTIYRIGVQSLRDPVLDSLDCPDLSTKTPKRGVTTTPIQALALMNDSFVQRQAADFAARLRREVGDEPDAQLEHGIRLAFGRPPELDEPAVAIALIREHGLEQFCWVLLNANEFIHVQ